MTRFDDLVESEGLEPDEELRLRRVHDLLLAAGPPPELPPALREPPSTRQAQVIPFPKLPPRRFGSIAIVAATAVLVAFAAGYFFGHSKKSASFTAEHVVFMHRPSGTLAPLATLKIAKADAVGNWPMRLVVRGLPRQARGSFYELWLTRGGKPFEPCGTFRVHANTTTVSFSVPYTFHRGDGWVVTTQPHGDATPGPVVLTT